LRVSSLTCINLLGLKGFVAVYVSSENDLFCYFIGLFICFHKTRYICILVCPSFLPAVSVIIVELMHHIFLCSDRN
jgi:hypothetical protein